MARPPQILSDEELAALTDAIKNRYGIDFTNYEKRSLKRGFVRLMNKNHIDSLLELWSKILKESDFFKSCIDDLTVNLTELFRNPEIWDEVGSLLTQFKHKTSINVWHAGCATGEEVYSMAMVAHNKGLLYKLKSLATDISSKAISKAKEGYYANELLPKYEKSLKKYLPNGEIKDMFDFEDGKAYIKKKFRVADFKIHNLVSDKMTRKFDIIFCRNVLIYFDEVLKLQVLESLVNALNDDGYLVLGYYDMLPESSKDLISQYNTDTRIYVPLRSLKQVI